ncbi:sigma-54-dependent Fis family transcriptional regulator [bacterium]|nr:sigma-54-dependent Fis family transcriptional regulator [bacterium]
MLEKGQATAPAREDDSQPGESVGEGWGKAVQDRRLREAEGIIASLRDTAASYQKFLSILEDQPQLFFASDPGILIYNTLRMAMNLVNAERAAFYRLDKAGALRLKQTLPEDLRFENISRTLVRDVLKNRRTLYHLQGEEFRGMERDSVLHLGLETVVVVPLEAEGRLMGVLYLDGKSRGQFSSGDIPTLETLTRLAATAMLQLDQLNEARLKGRRLELENQELRSVLSGQSRLGRLSAQSPKMIRVLQQLQRMAPLKTTVRLEGETGTGKTLIARILHEEGPWSDGSFVSLSCSAFPESLLESELFGSTKGAFTGATQTRLGLIEQSDGGTLFLDEIGDLPLPIQVKLLRVLEDGVIRRVGDNQERHVDFRLVVATHRNLETLIEEGLFREDLYYRVNVLNVKVPPLRERPEDILLLAEERIAFMAQTLGQEKPRLSRAAARRLMEHPWPGNVRQLFLCLERTLAMRDVSPVISPKELLLDEAKAGAQPKALSGEKLRAFVFRMEAEHLRSVLSETQGNISAAARSLGVSRQTLYDKMKAHDLPR